MKVNVACNSTMPPTWLAAMTIAGAIEFGIRWRKMIRPRSRAQRAGSLYKLGLADVQHLRVGQAGKGHPGK